MNGGDGVQVRPVIAYVLLALVSGLILSNGLHQEPTRYVVAGATPTRVAAESSVGEVILGQLLRPRDLELVPVASMSDEPVLAVHPFAGEAISHTVQQMQASAQVKPRVAAVHHTQVAQAAPVAPHVVQPARTVAAPKHGKAHAPKAHQHATVAVTAKTAPQQTKGKGKPKGH